MKILLSKDTYRDDCTPNLVGKFFLCHQNIPNVLFLSDHLPLLVLILLPTYQWEKMTWQQIGHDYVALEMTDVIKHCLGMPYNGKFCPWPNLNSCSKNNGAEEQMIFHRPCLI